MGAVPELRSGLATLPAQQPAEDPAEALALVFDDRRIPTVPVLPTAGATLLAQAAGAFEGVRELRAGSLQVELASFGVRPVEAVTIHGPAFDLTRAALGAASGRTGVGAGCGARRHGGAGEPRGRVDPCRGASGAGAGCRPNGVGLPQRSVVRACRAAVPLAPVVVVMIEGRLVGSAHPTFPFTSREVRSLLDPVVEALDSTAGASEVVIGVHVPGRADLRAIVSSGVSLVSMPPEASVVGWAPWIQALLDNGGHIA
ncbi:MAG: hypothetical protein M5U19_19360 [Microthrixaceae bacterium]|nr:hypothetical protein [Microthrixaceae bacterium]